jgi:hypothetical protein
MKTTLWALLSLTLSLGACAATAPTWVKMNGDYTTWQADQYTCERDMRMSAASFGGIYVREYNAQQFYDRCMRARGWLKANINPDGSPR